MSRLRVLHIVWSATMGGIEQLVLNLCKTQMKNPLLDVAVMIAKSEGALLEEFKKSDITLIEGGFINGRDQRPEVRERCAACFAGFDILHMHSYNPVIAKEAKRSKCKIIYTEHGNFGFGRKKTLSDYLIRFLLKRFLNNDVDFITFNSNFTKNISEKRYGLTGINRQVVYNGVPEIIIADLKNISSRKKPDEIIISTIGRLAAVKRIDRVITSFSYIKTSGIRLVIMGDGPLKERLFALAEKLKISERITFLPTGNARSLINESDICILPSQNEAFGLVAIEAYQFGKPVLVFGDGGGVTELVQQIEPELIAGDELTLANKIQNLIENPKLIHSDKLMSKRKKFAQQFTIEKMETTLASIYQSL